MRLVSSILVIAVLLTAGHCVTAGAQAKFDARLGLGVILLEREAGDRSTVQETFNLEKGFSVSQIRLSGSFNPEHYLSFNLREVNLESRGGEIVYRGPARLRLSARFDQHRRVFDADRNVVSKRKDWRFSARVTPHKWVRLSGHYNVQIRDGRRMTFPAGTASNLGTRYDNQLQTWRAEVELRRDGRALAVAYDYSGLADDIDDVNDRTGNVISARLFSPDPFSDKLTHMFRGALGKHEIKTGDHDYTLVNFQYTGALKAHERLQLKYNYRANRIDNDATQLKTDNFQNNFDATYYHEHGNVFAGYGHELNDDDKTLTSYNTWRLGGSLNYMKKVSAHVNYTTRTKTAEESLTLLKDIEVDRFKAKVQFRPTNDFSFGGRVATRTRHFPDIAVESNGRIITGFATYEYPEWGGITGDVSYSKDEYIDTLSTFKTNSQIVTARAHIDRVPNLTLAGGVTYLNIGEDLDIEKSIIFIEGMYTVLDDYHLEVKYNIYNYDDYIILDRYYTANAVWINVVYDFRKE